MTVDDVSMTDSDALRLGFLLTDGFALMSYASAAEPFRAANVLAGRTLYRWRHLSADGAGVRASNGVTLSVDAALSEAAELDILFVFAAGDPARFDDWATFAGLRRMAGRRVRIAGVSGGPWLMARAGLLDGYRCTIHWEHRAAFTEAFPKASVQPGLYVIDRDRLTCAGGTAGLDLAIALIGADHGPALAALVGDWHLRAQPREAGDAQRASLRERYGVTNPRVLAALAVMEAGVEEPLDRAGLARSVGVSLRQLERLFAAHLGGSIGRAHLKLRLARVMDLLRETGLSTAEVAVACGFVSSSHFSRAFKAEHGRAPSEVRTRCIGDGRRRT